MLSVLHSDKLYINGVKNKTKCWGVIIKDQGTGTINQKWNRFRFNNQWEWVTGFSQSHIL